MNDDIPTTRAVPPDPPAPRSGISAGQRLFGRYTLEAVAGRGGMGVVWQARDEELGETVALKFLPEIVACDAVAVDELKEETRRARRLTHPHIVRIHDFLRDDTMAAVSMEFVDGCTLAQLRLEQPGKVFSVETLGPIAAQLCSALDYAHTQAKIVHRDLKPANLLVTRDGQLKVTDFGIARSLTETATRLTGSAAGTSGTLLYMSPQQLTGAKATPADDIYGLGATLYDLLTGKPPFYTGDITHQILHKTPPTLAEQCAGLDHYSTPIPPRWEKVIHQCLDKEAAKRPATVRDIARQLGWSLDGTFVSKPAEPKVQVRPAPSLHYEAGGAKSSRTAEADQPAPSSIHYPNPDRNRTFPKTWLDYLLIVVLFATGGAYYLGLFPLPRPWLDQPAGPSPALEAARTAPSAVPASSTEVDSTPSAITSREPAAMAGSTHQPAGSISVSPSSVPALPPANKPEAAVAPVPSAATVNLAVSPASAHAFLDFDPMPLPVPVALTQVAPGPHTLHLRAPGFVEKQMEFTVAAGQTLNLEPAQLVAGTASLLIDSQPAFVQFAMSNDTGHSYSGVTPWDDKHLPIGNYTITFTRSGDADAVKQFTLADQGKLRVMADYSGGSVNVSTRESAAALVVPAPDVPTANVSPAPAAVSARGRLVLEITGPADFQLFVNGRVVAVPLSGSSVALPAGQALTLELKADGYQTLTRQINLGPGESTTWRAEMQMTFDPHLNQATPIAFTGSTPATPADQTVAAAMPAVATAQPITAASGPDASPPANATGRPSDPAPVPERTFAIPNFTPSTVPVRTAPHLLQGAQPDYPASLRAAGIHGIVTVRLLIQANGLVGSVEEISSPDSRLTQTVKDALGKFRFEPAKLDGTAVDQKVTMDFEFKLDQ